MKRGTWRLLEKGGGNCKPWRGQKEKTGGGGEGKDGGRENREMKQMRIR
jgi:hypothetical protein